MIAGLLLLATAAAVLVAGAELFVEHAAAAARRLGVTVVAVGILLAGAEPEELVTAVLASVRDRPDLAAGDALGANVTMLTAALGLAALARPLPTARRMRTYGALATVAGGLAWITLLDRSVTRAEGVALVVAYVALVAAVWWREKAPPTIGELAEHEDGQDVDDGEDDDDADDGAERPPAPAPAARALALSLAGLAVMALGGHLAVEGAIRVAEGLGGADAPVGLTLLALATTAELFALVAAAVRRRVSDVAVAAVVGSVAYNATMTLGAAAVASPLQVAGVTPVVAAVAAALPLVVIVASHRGLLGRPAGAVLAASYAVYVGSVLRG
ncbi:MAG: sodium:calcium antiporter [Actinomycetota bacterium]|nr:sodium:calcium antiporter [Actinomycetota bacterium]